MTAINWEEFGLKKNPYDVNPLVEGGEVNVMNAFIGRDQERSFLEDILSSEERACVAICGNVGVGKTTIANYEKYLWKYTKKNKLLFSFRRELEASETLLTKQNFILEIIGSIMREIELLDPQLIKSNMLLQKMNHLIDITQTFGMSGNISTGIPGIFDIGANFSEKQTMPPFHITTVMIEKSFQQLLTFLRTNTINGRTYQGLVVHVNNFDVVMEHNRKETLKFFAEIRDFLQTPYVYFIFLGPNNFFRDIISKESRVKSIFIQQPLFLEPLTKKELVIALNRRLELLQSNTVQKIIKPFGDEVIFEFYDLFSGDIRMIMTALRDALMAFSLKLPKTLTIDEAMVLLGTERMNRIESKLTEEQLRVLKIILEIAQPVTQAEVSAQLQKAQTNMSSYYFSKLSNLGIIEVKREEGKHKYWYLTKEYLPLQRLQSAQENLRKQFDQKTNQLKLF